MEALYLSKEILPRLSLSLSPWHIFVYKNF